MAKIIPSTISALVKSNAEKKLFEQFRDLEKCNDWVIFHSYGIENHIYKKHGEIDFIVVAPNYGVFILEVKGGEISKKDGRWTYTNRYGVEHTKSESPFDQAKSGMYSVLEQLSLTKGRRFNNEFIWGYGVMFPDIDYNIESLEYNKEQVFDKRNHNNIRDYIINLSKYYREKEKFEKTVPLTSYAAEEIINILKTDFTTEINIVDSIEISNNIIYELTEQQYHFVKGLTYNERCLIHGGAGTGKTVLATKVAKDEIAKGKSVALFCYNLHLSEKLKADLGDIPSNCYVGSFTQFLEQLVVKHNLVNIQEIENLSLFYKEELPCLALEALEKERILFDYIVIDESQDLVNDYYFDILDLILDKGISKGEWCAFGDFEIQTIYNRNVTLENVIKSLEQRNCSFAKFELPLNCRNTLNIQKTMKKVIPTYNTLTLNQDANSPKVKHIKYQKEEELISKLNDEIRKLINKGIVKKDIIVLSPYTLPDYMFKSVNGLCKYSLDAKGIRSSTIHAFKGLESKVIILIKIYNKVPKELIFTGCSRAKALLYIFEKV